jgi:DNA-binding transcriptional regulator YiaG
MPNVARVLKEEIARIARKEVKAAVAPGRKASVRLRKDVAGLKGQVASLEMESKSLQALLKRMAASQPATAAVPDTGKKPRITAKGLRSLRRKLGLSQAEFAGLIGVSRQAVANWEKRQGAVRVRETTKSAILPLRTIGAREARKRLMEMKVKKSKQAASKRGKRGKRRGN